MNWNWILTDFGLLNVKELNFSSLQVILHVAMWDRRVLSKKLTWLSSWREQVRKPQTQSQKFHNHVKLKKKQFRGKLLKCMETEKKFREINSLVKALSPIYDQADGQTFANKIILNMTK